MGIRKNQSTLTLSEKSAFVAAVKALKENGIYDVFVAQHRAESTIEFKTMIEMSSLSCRTALSSSASCTEGVTTLNDPSSAGDPGLPVSPESHHRWCSVTGVTPQ